MKKKSPPPVTVATIIDVDEDAVLYAAPKDQPDLRLPLKLQRKNMHQPGIGDLVLIRIEKNSDRPGDDCRERLRPGLSPAPSEADASASRRETYKAVLMKTLDKAPPSVMGVVDRLGDGWMLRPINRREKKDYVLTLPKDVKVNKGDIVRARPEAGNRGPRQAEWQESFGHADDPEAISIIAMAEAGLDPEFPDKVIDELQNASVPALGKRRDWRDTPLVTIDGADARDFDDAVFAEELDGGRFRLVIAIADVCHYLRHGTALDKEAYKRGNSTYFPDRVVPMLPERLSNDLCSLRPNEDRACMVMQCWISAEGKLEKYRVGRGLMRSAARLTYEQVQAAYDGVTDETTKPLVDAVIRPLYKAFYVLDEARKKRSALALDLPEQQIVIDRETGKMTGVRVRDRLDAHRLIEEFMVLANVAAARCLQDRKAPCMYRVHDRPDADKLSAASELISNFGLSLPKGQVPEPKILNRVLEGAIDHDYAPLIHQAILRCQSQAVYMPDHHGHYGLALQSYAHFTSPIRRYADVMVHRSLIRAYGLGEGGLDEGEAARMVEIGEHISTTERNSMVAERSAVDRFTACYLSAHMGARFEGRISGLNKFGLFVRLDETGADGIVPIRSLPDDFYIHDEAAHALVGRRNRIVYRLGAKVQVEVLEADRITGSTVFGLVDGEKGADIPGFKPPSPPRGGKHRNRPSPMRGGKPRQDKKSKKKTIPKHIKRKNKKK